MTALWRRFSLGLAVAVIALAAPMSALGIPLEYGKILYPNGSVCGSGLCDFIVIDTKNQVSADVLTGSLSNYNATCAISYPDGNTLQCPKAFSANAYLSGSTTFWADGDPMTGYGRENCSGGGYHFSPYHLFRYSATYPWWGGSFQLGSGCQTLLAHAAGLFNP